MSVAALPIFGLTYITRWFSFATQSYMLAVEKPLPASLISVSTALIFPVILIFALQSFGLTGIWFNFAGTAILAGNPVRRDSDRSAPFAFPAWMCRREKIPLTRLRRNGVVF